MIIIVGVGGWVLYFVVGVHTLLPTMLIIDRVDKGDDNLKQKAPLYFLFRNVLLKILYNFISYGINLVWIVVHLQVMLLLRRGQYRWIFEVLLLWLIFLRYLLLILSVFILPVLLYSFLLPQWQAKWSGQELQLMFTHAAWDRAL